MVHHFYFWNITFLMVYFLKKSLLVVVRMISHVRKIATINNWMQWITIEFFEIPTKWTKTRSTRMTSIDWMRQLYRIDMPLVLTYKQFSKSSSLRQTTKQKKIVFIDKYIFSCPIFNLFRPNVSCMSRNRIPLAWLSPTWDYNNNNNNSTNEYSRAPMILLAKLLNYTSLLTWNSQLYIWNHIGSIYRLFLGQISL